MEASEILSLVAARTGHFCLGSGHHGRLWLDLDGLFTTPTRVAPFVNSLAQALRTHDPDAVCGPLTGGAFLAQMLSTALQRQFLFTERVLPPKGQGSYRATYRLPRGLQDGVRGKRVAIVDDVVSAGSAARGTHAELERYGARCVVVGALVALGSTASTFSAEWGVATAFVTQLPYDLWDPEACPLCAVGQPLEDVTATSSAGSG